MIKLFWIQRIPKLCGWFHVYPVSAENKFLSFDFDFDADFLWLIQFYPTISPWILMQIAINYFRPCNSVDWDAEAPLTIFLSRYLRKVWVKSHLSASYLRQKKYKKARIRDISSFATNTRIRDSDNPFHTNGRFYMTEVFE